MTSISHLIDRALWLIPVLLSLSVHEWAHAWTALKLGDDTAKRLGRVTLNPLAHIDPIGTLLLPLLGVPFGWARPVPVQTSHFRPTINRRLGGVLVALAGPASNVAQAAVAIAVLKLWGALFQEYEIVYAFIVIFIRINLALAIFNMIPVPPLDGSWIIGALLPQGALPLWIRITRSTVARIVLLIGVFHYSGRVITPALEFVERTVGGF